MEENKEIVVGASPPTVLSVDITEISNYEKMIGEIVGIGYQNGPYYMQNFLKAIEAVNKLYCKAIYESEAAERRRKQKKSIARLDKADVYLASKGIKPTAGDREAYSECDTDYLIAAEDQAKKMAIAEFFKNKLEVFQKAHDDAKKIFDKTKEPMGGSLGMPTNNR